MCGWPCVGPVPRTTQMKSVFFSFPSTELAGPVLPGSGVLHARAPGGQAASAHGPQEPPQVLLDGQRPECQGDARPPLFPRHQLQPQEDQPPKSEGRPPSPEPPQTLHQKQLQSLLRRARGRGVAQVGRQEAALDADTRQCHGDQRGPEQRNCGRYPAYLTCLRGQAWGSCFRRVFIKGRPSLGNMEF